jgi:predicted permease
MNPTIAESLPVISLVMVGYILKKINVIKLEDGPLLTKLILTLTLPSVIFLSISQANVEPTSLGLLAICSFIVVMTLRLLSGRITKWLNLEDSVAGVVILTSMVMNIGTFLFPVIQAVYGQAGISRLAAFDIGNSLVTSGYGYYLASTFGTKKPCGLSSSLKKVIMLPILWAVLIGLAVNLLNIELNPFILKMIKPISAAHTPLAMIALGVFVNFKFPKFKLISLSVFLRMGVGYILGLGIVFLFNLQGLDRIIVVMGSSVPVGMAPMVFAASEGLDTELAAGIISFSIIIGMVITPFLLII